MRIAVESYENRAETTRHLARAVYSVYYLLFMREILA